LACWSSRRRAEDAVKLSEATKLLDLVPPYVGRYAVTYAISFDELRRIAESLPVDTLQLHDDIEWEIVSSFRSSYPYMRLVKALHVGSSAPDPGAWREIVDAFLFDSADHGEGRIGGTGKTHDWGITGALVSGLGRPAILAGGLRVDNVAAAVEQVRPWAVNVNSGVEVDGRKDLERVAAFVRNANASACSDLRSWNSM
jgi:phosphoribosylanthranilate isomerase